MYDEEWYEITDLKLFVESSRVLVYSLFGSVSDDPYKVSIDELNTEEQKEIDTLLTYSECMDIIKPVLKESSADNEYKISSDEYLDFVESINLRLISNILKSLVNKGLLETGFDDSINDFIFWIPDENKKQDSKE
tara:strand:+ start:541 stop:945 length:405 start_codon:yes stop_codon:yes gene_type:complete